MSARRTVRPTRLPLRLQTLEARLTPSTFTVSNNANTGTGSLRQAVFDANANPGTDLIDFSSFFNVPRTITLSSEISITGAVTIDGPSAANVTISGNDAVGIFNTQAAAAGTAIGFVDLTLRQGRITGTGVGGAISAVDEAISATRCVLTQRLSVKFPSENRRIEQMFTSFSAWFSRSVTPEAISKG